MNGWWARWRVAARIARRDARRHRGRTILVAVLVGLPVLAGSAGLVVLRSSTATDATYSRMTIGTVAQARVEYQCPVRIVQSLREGYGCQYEESEAIVPTVAGLEATITARLGDDAVLTRLASAGVRVESATQARTADYGEVELTDDVTPVTVLAAGALPVAPGEALAGAWLADNLQVSPGDTLRVRTGDAGWTTVRVTGILARTAQTPDLLALPGTVPGVWPRDDDAAPTLLEWFVGGAEPVTWDDTLALNEAGLIVRSRTVLADPPPHSAMPFHTEGYAALDAPSASSLTVYAALIGIGLTEAVLLIGPAFAVGAQRSRRVLGLLAAVGADRAHLRRTVLAAGVVIGFAASAGAVLAGALLGAALVSWVPGGVFPNLVIPWRELAGVGLVGVSIAVVAASAPAWAAGRLDVVAAIRDRPTPPASRRGRALIGLVGLVVLGLGIAAAMLGALRATPAVVLVGVVATLLGVVVSAGGVLSLAARLAHRLPTAGRLALRDAARHRARTGPALAAVIAAVAAAAAGATYLQAGLAHQAAAWAPSLADGVVSVAVDPAGMTDGERDHVVRAAVDAAQSAGQVADPAPLRVVAAADPARTVWITPVTPEQNLCPLYLLTRPATAAEDSAALSDSRCAPEGEHSTFAVTLGLNDVLIDDGTAIRATGLDGADAAATALAGGSALVNDAAALWPDGTVHLSVEVQETDGTVAEPAKIVLPGSVLDTSSSVYDVVLPLAAEPELAELGLTVAQVGVLADPERPWTAAQTAAVSRAVDDAVGTAEFMVDVAASPEPQVDASQLIGVLIAAALALAATWIAVGLAAADQQVDLATLAAVGADPRLRRTLAGAQAGLIAGLGSTVGVAVGVVLGVALTLTERGSGLQADPSWHVSLPWPTLGLAAVGLPAVAAGVVAVLTRSDPQVTHRMGS